MSNQNIADISAFESLQSGQNNQTGMNSMSVFNSKEELEKLAKQEDNLIKQYEKIKTQGTEIAKKRLKMYEDDVKAEKEKAAKNNTPRDELSKTLGELLKASSTTQQSPFES